MGHKKVTNLSLLCENGRNHRGDILWLCQCSCGKQSTHVGWQVRTGRIKSCGCSRAGKRKLDSPLKSIFRDYRDRAKNKNMQFSISLIEFQKLIQSDCAYCGSPPILRNRKGTILANGIDRIDNSTGYVLNNCVSCCKICNMAKNDLPHNVFVEWIARLVKFNK